MTPLSEAQRAALDKGRRALAARIAKENESGIKEPARTGRRVEHVKFGGGSKEKRAGTKEPPAPPARHKGAGGDDKGESRLERWLSGD